MRTFDVTLPGKKRIIFPPRCVVCEAGNPNGKLSLSFLGATTPSFSTIAVDAALDSYEPKYYSSNTTSRINDIPACRACAFGLKWYHRLLKFAYYTAWIPGLIPLLFLDISLFISIPFLILCAISPGLFALIFPSSFGATFMDNNATFEFKSKTVADEFLQLNSEAKLKSEEPKTVRNETKILEN